jgi:hypothetical protein
MPLTFKKPCARLITYIFLILVLQSCLTSSVCRAQTTSGTLIGGVHDASGNNLVRAKITVVNEENGNVRATRTDASGNFTLFNLPPGIYRATASKEGFLDQTVQRFPVQFNQKNVIRLPQFTLLQAALKGSVIDAAQIALPDATVIVASPATRVRRTATTDEQGHYSVSDLPPGQYLVTAMWRSEAGHGIATLPMKLDRSEVFAPPIKLTEVVRVGAGQAPQPQSPSSVVEGEQAATNLQLTDPARSVNFTERQLHSLPVGGATYMRSFDELALLIAGVAPPPYTPGARGPGVGFGLGTAGQFSVNGMRARSNNFSVDGSDNNDPDVGVRRQGFVTLVPQPLESIKEMSISTLLWDAELGRNPGAQVNAVSKYGANSFHGQAFGFFTDSRLNARNFFDTGNVSAGRKTPFTRTQAGFVIGGPLPFGRAQLYGSYEHLQVNASSEQHFSTPAASERRFLGGDEFGVLLSGTQRIFGPFRNTTPLGRNVLSLYPLPNNPSGPYGANTFSQVLPADGKGDVFSFRMTHQVLSGSQLNARYNLTNDRRVLPSVNRAIRSTLDARTRSHNLSLILDTPLTARLFNQARFSFGRTRLNFLEYPGSPFVFSASSIESVPVVGQPNITISSQTGALGALLIEPYSPVGVDVFTLPQQRASNTFQYADSMSWAAGRHSLKFGVNVRRYQLNSLQDRLYRPQAVYSGAIIGDLSFNLVPVTGVELASLGVASSVLQTVTNGPPSSALELRFTEYHIFFNDHLRLHRNFTLDFGVRYEYNSVPSEANRRIEDALGLRGLPAAGGSRFDTPLRAARFNAAVESYRRILDGRTRIYEPDRNNVGPHLGFAWSPGSGGRTAIRGGYGIYYDTMLGAVVSQSRNIFPNELPINVDPSFLQFDIFNLNNPAFLALTRDAAGNPVEPLVRLLSPVPCNRFGACNQFGGSAQDFPALIGQVFAQSPPGGLAFTLPAKKLRMPYAQQWHLTFEREAFNQFVLSAAYVGTKGTKLTRLTTPNLGPNVTPRIPISNFTAPFPIIINSSVQGGFISIPLTGNFCPPPGLCPDPSSRPNFTLGPYQIFEDSASSTYHAMQLEARNRYAHGFQLTASYTWSHAIDDVSDVLPIAGAPQLPQDSFNFRAERGDANFDIRHRFAASLVWDMPFFSNSRNLVKRTLSEWQLASIFEAHTGQPFTLNVPFDANLDGNLTDRPSTTDGLIFFNEHGPRRVVLAPGRQFRDFFTIGQVGAVGRNTARGDSFINLNLAVSRKFLLTEGQNLLIRMELFNALNRANFGLPIRSIGAPGFGSAVETVVPARMIQLALKYDF